MARKIEFTDADDIIREYLAGSGIREIAKKRGVSTGPIHRLILSRNVSRPTIQDRFDFHALHREHVEGKSILQISRETGVSRIEINRIFAKLGLEWRNRSEAGYQRYINNPGEGAILAAYAHAGRRGRADTMETKARRAKGRTNDRIGMFELDVIKALAERGIHADNQWPFGPYNIDVAIHEPTVAVEIYSIHPSSVRMAQLHERTEYLLDRGINLLIVQVSYPNRIFMLDAVCEKIFGFRDFVRSNPSPLGQYGVIRGNGYIPATSSHYLDGRPAVMSF